MKAVGIIGLGNIGRPVAANLAEAGFEVTAVRRASAEDFPPRRNGDLRTTQGS